MTRLGICILTVALGATSLLTAAPSMADDAAQAFQEGGALLQQARFEEALASYDRAVQLDAARQEYHNAAAILRRVLQLREQLANEQDPGNWERIARSLRGYYQGERIHTASLALDRQFHERLNTAESAEMLAETQLELGQALEARAVLEPRNDLDSRPTARMLLGIALARSGEASQAKDIARRVSLPANAGPEDRIRAARLQALAGDRAQALALLAAAFESTPPSRLEDARARVKTCPDFAAIAGSGDFAKILSTQSKVSESSCSSGANCGACPSRTSCSGGAAATSKPK
jgi:tetratricopeptide (TPR) repeat protein